MTTVQVVQLLSSLASLGMEVVKLAEDRGDDPVESLERLRSVLRQGITTSAQAELDAKFGK